MSALAEVVTIYDSNYREIPAMLRKAADSIETEMDDPEVSPTRAIVAVQIAECGKIEIYGWGKTDVMDSMAHLQLAAARLMSDRLEAME